MTANVPTKISIITPVFNDVRVGRALKSIFAQCHDLDIETIVIDAGSIDGTLDVLDEFASQISVLVSEPDRGCFDGMNKGIARATGDIVGILNADDCYADPYVLRDIAATIEESGSDAAYGDVVYVNTDGEITRYWRAGHHRPFRWRLGWMPPHTSFFVRRHAYERYGVFDLDDFPITADYELVLRFLVKYKMKISYIDRVLVRMGAGGRNDNSGQRIKGLREIRRAWKKNRLPGGVLAPIAKPVSKIHQLFSRPPANQSAFHSIDDWQSK